MRHETLQPTSPTTEFVEACGLTTTKMLYACENVAVPHRLVRVNVAPPTPMRAPGECPGTFALESAMDELAYALGIDPLELRLRNHADKDPAEGKPWSSKHLLECYDIGAERFGWSRRKPEPGSMKDGDLLVGWGMATAIYPGNRRPASAKIRLSADGRALVQAATQDLGTGSYTVFTQVAADALGLPLDHITFELGDTDFPPSPVSGGSNTAASVSEAVIQAAAALKKKLGAGDDARGDALIDLVKRSGAIVFRGPGGRQAGGREDEAVLHPLVRRPVLRGEDRSAAAARAGHPLGVRDRRRAPAEPEARAQPDPGRRDHGASAWR